MKKIIISFLLFSSFQHLSFCQGINTLWLLGYDSQSGRPWGGSNMNFFSGVMDTSYQIRKMPFDGTNGVICNKNGDLLFSSNGVWIANNANDTMMNGSGLNPSSYTTSYKDYGLGMTQGNLIIPFPADSNKYYLFHETIDVIANPSSSLYLYYSVIDMAGDSGRGDVIQKNNILLSDTLFPGILTACKHANGRDWWLIAHQLRAGDSISYINSSSLYYKFLISSAGIFGPDTQSLGREYEGGQGVFSPDGKYYATYDAANLDIFDFDRCSGIFAPKVHANISDTTSAFGVAFSPNSQVLYVSTGPHVYQFDMTVGDIPASKTAVLNFENGISTGFFLDQLAPDGKIYILSGYDTSTMHVINNPDILGSGCNACHDCVALPALNAWTIANHPNYFLGAETGSVCDSLNAVQNLSVQNSKLAMFPNPLITDEITFIYNVSPEKRIISIYNIEGEEIAQYYLPQWSSVQHLKLPKLSSGIYMARLSQGNAVSDIKFIKE